MRSETAGLPVVESLTGFVDPQECFLRLCHLPHCAFLDSALERPRLGQYSFLTADPFEWIEIPWHSADCLAELAGRLATFTSPVLPDLPPFQGGLVGLFSYELNRSLERVIPATRFNDFPLPLAAAGLYDTVLALDHERRRAWIISQGFPEQDAARRRRRAEERIRQFKSWLSRPPSLPAFAATSRCDTAPQYSLAHTPGITSNFSRDGYLEAVCRVVEYIRAGDVFQVNLSQRLLCPATCSSPELYLRLRRHNPATFAGYIDLGAAQILSSSPERFLLVDRRRVEARPIKGTRPRLLQPEASLFAGAELLESEKDRAENIMIVDLLRNDLSRVCRPDSIRVTELCSLEVYQYVQHLVSAIEGTLADDVQPLDLLAATFPGGSVTGAPKIRAMQIIAELEPTPRHAYCGSLGYIGFNGQMDLNILIRTVTASQGWWQIPVGGGITVQSNPQAEYQETLDKAAGLLAAII